MWSYTASRSILLGESMISDLDIVSVRTVNLWMRDMVNQEGYASVEEVWLSYEVGGELQ